MQTVRTFRGKVLLGKFPINRMSNFLNANLSNEYLRNESQSSVSIFGTPFEVGLFRMFLEVQSEIFGEMENARR